MLYLPPQAQEETKDRTALTHYWNVQTRESEALPFAKNSETLLKEDSAWDQKETESKISCSCVLLCFAIREAPSQQTETESTHKAPHNKTNRVNKKKQIPEYNKELQGSPQKQKTEGKHIPKRYIDHANPTWLSN